ncbi:hypothetical protein TKK_0009437 [Trichogramma kaykai]|uniref:Uncharacterized protein n=1 Tax=Trichogramma kaykai TaxID=54128 RepID=A0ABD2X0Q5_9HYME
MGRRTNKERRQRRKLRIKKAKAMGLAVIPKDANTRQRIWDIIELSLRPDEVEKVRSDATYYLPLIIPLVFEIERTRKEIRKLERHIEAKHSVKRQQRLPVDDDVLELYASSIETD